MKSYIYIFIFVSVKLLKLLIDGLSFNKLIKYIIDIYNFFIQFLILNIT